MLFQTVLEAIGLLRALISIVFDSNHQEFEYLESFKINFFNSQFAQKIENFLKENKYMIKSMYIISSDLLLN